MGARVLHARDNAAAEALGDRPRPAERARQPGDEGRAQGLLPALGPPLLALLRLELLAFHGHSETPIEPLTAPLIAPKAWPARSAIEGLLSPRWASSIDSKARVLASALKSGPLHFAG